MISLARPRRTGTRAREPEVNDIPYLLDDRAIVLETIDSMLKLRIITFEMRRQLEDLRGRVEAFGAAGETGRRMTPGGQGDEFAAGRQAGR